MHNSQIVELGRVTKWLAPAKINLFLHVVGRRDNGYHELQTVFQFIDWYDELEIEILSDGQILQPHETQGVNPQEDLTLRAANLLKQASGTPLGAMIGVKKSIPQGAGLGGGSSDAATTLLALNQLWGLNWSKARLAELGLTLGADVPVFIAGDNAWAQGIGELLTPINLAIQTYVMAIPAVHVSTKEIFSQKALTYTPQMLKICDFNYAQTVNALQPITTQLYPEVGEVVDFLSEFGEPRMTGTGAAVFLPVQSQAQGQVVCDKMPEKWTSRVIKSLNNHPHK